MSEQAPKLSQARTTGPFQQRFYIRAQAWWVRPTASLPFVQGRGEVFDGQPSVDGSNGVFKTAPEITTDDLLAVLENVERICRDKIATMS
jgi:hypothetical protein